VDAGCVKLTQIAIRQERTLTARTKPVICHEETPNYFLNTFSIHNYAFIRAALPASLRETPLRVAAQDVQRVRKQAAQQVRQKKAQRVSSSVPAQDPGVPASPQAPPIFDQQSKQTQKRTKKPAPPAPSNSIDISEETQSVQLTPCAVTTSQHPHPPPSSILPNGIVSLTGSDESVPSFSTAPVLNQDPFRTFAPSPHMYALHQTAPVVYPIPTPVASHYRPPGSIQGQPSHHAPSQIPNSALIGCHEYARPLANYHMLPGTSSRSDSLHGMHPAPHHAMNPLPPLMYNDSSSSWGQTPAGYFPSESLFFSEQYGTNVAQTSFPEVNTVLYGPTPSRQQFRYNAQPSLHVYRTT
jgi:hypothetical protein